MSLGVDWTFQTISPANIVVLSRGFGKDYYLAGMGYYFGDRGDWTAEGI